MPLIRLQIRNEFGHGDPELYRGASSDDPKAILDGVAVAGLVGILRQLGDLVEFAAEVFQGLHENIMDTAARSHKTITRLQRIEAALPSLERSMLSQTSHIHFAYTAGWDWHADIQTEQNHLLHSDLPPFILDSYEDCRNPPCLSLLDKYDAAGSGACLRRYSNPSYFKTEWAGRKQIKIEKAPGGRMVSNGKKRLNGQRKGPSWQSSEIGRAASISQHYSRSNFAEHIVGVNSSMEPEVIENNKAMSSELKTPIAFDESIGEDVCNSLQGHAEFRESSFICDLKTEILRPMNTEVECIPHSRHHSPESLPVSLGHSRVEEISSCPANLDEDDTIREGTDADSLAESSQGHVEFGTSSVTWNVKTETVRPKGPDFESIPQVQYHASESLQLSLKHSRPEEVAASPANLDQDNPCGEDANAASPCKSLQMRAECGPPSEMWDVKTEILRPTSEVACIPQGQYHALESLPSSLDHSRFEEAAACPANLDQDDTNGDGDIDSPCGSFQGCAEFGIPSAMWDVKTELVRPTCSEAESIHQCQLHAPELLPMSSEHSRSEEEAASSPNSNQDNVIGEGANADSSYNSLPGHVEFGMSSVMLDVKTEVVRPTSTEFESIPQVQYYVPDSLPVSLDHSRSDEVVANTPNLDQEDIVLEIESNVQACSCGKPFEDLTSGTENYTDALNDIESEVEMDSECQSKWELSTKYDIKNIEVGQGADGVVIAARISECCGAESPMNSSTSTETPLTSYSSVSKEMDPNSTLLDCPKSFTHLQLQQFNLVDSTPECSANACTSVCVSNLRDSESPVGSLPEESCIPCSHENKIMDNPCISQELSNVLDIPSVKFWTNGILLGLEPSKPRDFVVSTAPTKNFALEADSGTCSQTVMPKLANGVEISTTSIKPIDHPEEKCTIQEKREQSLNFIQSSECQNLHIDPSSGQMGDLVQPECSTFERDKLEKIVVLEQCIPGSFTDTSETHNRINDSHCSNIFNQTRRAELLVNCNNQDQVNGVGHNNTARRSVLSGITQKFLLNGLGRKTTLGHSHSGSYEPLRTSPNRSEQRPFQIDQNKRKNGITIPGSYLEDLLQHGSSENLVSSPPLKHMNLSFHPITACNISKLKLEFPNGHHGLGGTSEDDVFPSFQLLPEGTNEVHDIGSESDDDTFYRSSLYPSDDLLSLSTESSSERWDFTETGGNVDDIYNDSQQVPSAASVSGAFEVQGSQYDSSHSCHEFINLNDENGIGSFECIPLLGLPHFDGTGSSGCNHLKLVNDMDSGALQSSSLQYLSDPPPPPPLPPLQWRTMRPGFVLAEAKQNMISECDSQADNMQVEMSGMTRINLKSEKLPTSGIEPSDLQVSIAAFDLKAAQPFGLHDEELNSNVDEGMDLCGSRQTNPSSNSKDLDEREDLLHQIRTKSFKLKRMLPTRSAGHSTEPATNVKVSAILEKANSIRQAFIGGDDENWSDG